MIMERHRQITHDIDTAADREITFLPDGHVALLQSHSETIEKELPSRVEGRPRTVQVQVQRFTTSEQYESMGDAYESGYVAESLCAHEPYDGGWRLEHIPDDIKRRCAEWADASQYPTIAELVDAAKDIASQPADYLYDSQPCPHCPAETRYACYTSGWSRELYRSPLVEVTDEATAKCYEVPFNAALYVATTPEALQYRVDYTIDQHEGRLFAARSLTLDPTTLTREYVVAATGGKIIPDSDEVVLTTRDSNATSQRLRLDNWSEQKNNRRQVSDITEENNTPHEMIEVLQNKIMLAYAERVDAKDYNAMFARVRQALGERSLGIVFGREYRGMGESEMVARAYNPEKRTVRQILAGMDSADVIERLHQQLEEKRLV